MKIRSRALYCFLLEAGVLEGPAEEIARAKAEYRRLYKKEWRQRQRPRKEIRFEVTLRQYHDIQVQAEALRLKPTTYAKRQALRSIGERVPEDWLLEVLQLVSMATIAASHNPATERIYQSLITAENLLLRQIRPNNTEHGRPHERTA